MKRSCLLAVASTTLSAVLATLSVPALGATLRSPYEWAKVLKEKFSTPAASGNVLETYSRSMVAYHDNAQYRRANLSVHDGKLDIKLKGTTGAAVVFGPPHSVWGQTYGKFRIRFQVTGGSSYGAAFMLWPTSDVWSHGEIDFPEGSFDDQIHVFHHPTPCDLDDVPGTPPHCASFDGLPTGKSWHTTHTATTEWTPGMVRYYLDNKLIKTVTHDVPTTKHRMTVQVAPVSGKKTEGHLFIHSVAIYALK